MIQMEDRWCTENDADSNSGSDIFLLRSFFNWLEIKIISYNYKLDTVINRNSPNEILISWM